MCFSVISLLLGLESYLVIYPSNWDMQTIQLVKLIIDLE